MRIEILTIGNELLNGDLADTNTQRLARLLRELGLPIKRAQTVPDGLEIIAAALREVADRADVVLVSGGLGPTEDDLTLEAAALAAGVPLVTHAPTVTRLQERFAARGLPMTPNNLRQAQVPSGAEVFDNPVGTAPHVELDVASARGRSRLFFFPGVPSELQRMAEDYLRPWLLSHAPVRVYRSTIFKTFGRTESQVATFLDALPRDPRMHVAYRAHFPEIQVSLHIEEPDETAAAALLDASSAHVRLALGPIIYSEQSGDTLAAVVVRELVRRGETLALAESCTGGLVGRLITDIAGASAAFVEGFVTYANAAKTAHLAVPEALLATHGAVSEPVARAMAEGARAASGATWAVAVTGIAGPGGGTPEKPVGTIHLAVAGPDGTTHVQRRFPFDRERIRVVSAWSALDLLRRRLFSVDPA
ncbi:MAG: CinA family nicotinamide mononucleotide deamidase-related protein [Deltaproteobacteria bacterium]|nr:CinA family nicotinamide mononucleotide deamidase-related protein [Deltaproteobacteria bacterium]